MEHDLYYVYVLINPIDKSIFYVGLTYSPFYRLLKHIYNSNQKIKSPLYEYINIIRQKGFNPILKSIYSGSKFQCTNKEIETIKEFKIIHGLKFNK